MRFKFLLISIVFLFLISLASASITCSPTSLSNSYTIGQAISSQNLSCINSANTTVSLTAVGSYFSISSNSIGSLEQKTITVSFSSAPSAGTYYGLITFSDSSSPISITMNAQQQLSSTCSIDIFPLSLSNIKLQQGEKKTRTILVTLPQCYNGYVDFRAVSLQTDQKPIILGEISLGRLQPGSSVQVPIELDAMGEVSTGSYSDILQLNIANSSGIRVDVSQVTISVMVSVGVSPYVNFSLSNLPSCSLNSIQMSLNNSYKLTCTSTDPNIVIRPIIDSKYIKGLSVTESSSQFIYEFQPILLGITSVSAEFLYKNSPIGTNFFQEVKISPSGSAPAGSVNLDVDYFQSGTKKDISQLSAGDVTILILDSITKSIVPSFLVYLNGLSVNNTFKLDSDKKYELRVTSPNYIDRVVNISVSKLPLGIIITPDKGTFEVGETINATTNPENGSILMNNVVVTSPISLLSEGVFTLKAVKEGYESTERNITVKKSIYITSGLESYDKWAVGTNVALSLSDNAPWNVTYNGTSIASGNDNIIKFKIEKSGKYEINAKGNMIASKTIENKGWFSWFKWSYLWWIIGGLAFIWIVFVLGGEKKEGGSSGFIFSPKISSQEG